MINTVLYVRHAESDANVIIHKSKKERKKLTTSQEEKINSYHDPDITEIGFKQAECTGKHIYDKIKDKKNIHVWISPFKRAQDTAKSFIDICTSNGLKPNITILNDLQEYTSSNKTLKDEQKQLGLVTHESYDMFFEQVLRFNDILKNELKNHTTDDILIIFGHSLFFSSLISYHINHEKNKQIDISSLQLPNCSISCESYNFETLRWKTFVIGNTSHIPVDIATGIHVPFSL